MDAPGLEESSLGLDKGNVNRARSGTGGNVRGLMSLSGSFSGLLFYANIPCVSGPGSTLVSGLRPGLEIHDRRPPKTRVGLTSR